MSVLIKGMGMPKRHLFEGFVAIGDGQIVVKDLENNKLFEGEIKEIPTPHGRLIDADRLLAVLKSMASTSKNVPTEAVIGLIDNQPVIVEKERNE